MVEIKWSILVANEFLRAVEFHWISAKRCVKAHARTMSILSNAETSTYELFFVKKCVLSVVVPV